MPSQAGGRTASVFDRGDRRFFAAGLRGVRVRGDSLASTPLAVSVRVGVGVAGSRAVGGDEHATTTLTATASRTPITRDTIGGWCHGVACVMRLATLAAAAGDASGNLAASGGRLRRGWEFRT